MTSITSDPVVKKEIKEKQSPTSWWVKLDQRVKIEFFIFIGLLAMLVILKGKNPKTALFVAGLVIFALILLSAKREEGEDVISPQQAVEIAKEELEKRKGRVSINGIAEIEYNTDVRFNGFCSPLINMNGIAVCYFAGFDLYHNDGGSIDYYRAWIAAKAPYIGFVDFQKVNAPFDGIHDSEPSRVSVVPWIQSEAKRKGYEKLWGI